MTDAGAKVVQYHTLRCVISAREIKVGMSASEQAVSGEELLIVGNGLFQKPHCLTQMLRGAGIKCERFIKRLCPQVTVIGDKIRGRWLLNRSFLGGGKFCLKLICNRLSNVALNCKYVIEWAVIPLRPHMPVASGIDQLGSDPNAVAGRLDAAFNYVCHPKFVCNLTQIPLHTGLVLHYRGATDHLQIRDLGKIGEDLILDGIGEESVVRISAQTFKRQNCDAFLRQV